MPRIDPDRVDRFEFRVFDMHGEASILLASRYQVTLLTGGRVMVSLDEGRHQGKAESIDAALIIAIAARLGIKLREEDGS